MKHHPGDEELVRFADDDLTPAEAAEIGGHISACGQCGERIESVREALDGYQLFHETVLKKALGPPPRPWSAWRERRVVRFPLKRMLAAAAMVTLAVGLARRLERAPAVKASELLRKAAEAEQSATEPRRRIRIHSRRLTLVRAARMALTSEVSADAVQIRAIFEAAGYSWEDPLSVRAFSRWREGLAQKQDRVAITNGSYVVNTSTSEGVLAEASLTLRTRDLHAVAGTLQFRSANMVEMAEVDFEATAVPEAPKESPVLPEPASSPIPAAPRQVGPSDELHVLAALHRIGADLGEPVEVRREGSAVVVKGIGLAPARQEQVRAAVSGIPSVEVQFEGAHGRREHTAGEPRPVEPRPNPQGPNPLIAALQARQGENIAELSDRVLNADDRAIERAYALRGLARRFPIEVERQMNVADRRELAGIVSEHAGALARAVSELRRLLEPILPEREPGDGNQQSDWRGGATAILATVESLDQMLDGTVSADGGSVAEMLAQLDSQVAAMAAAAREMAR